MSQIYYTGSDGARCSADVAALASLAQSGIIRPETIIEYESGARAPAGQIAGLVFGNASGAASQGAGVPVCRRCGRALQADQKFCPSCGTPVSPTAPGAGASAGFCSKCGAPRQGGERFCTKCGAPVDLMSGVGATLDNAFQGLNGQTRITAGILALLLGGFGAHKFYLGSWGWGVVYILASVSFIPSIVAFVEGIMFLTQSDEEFARRYPPETQSPFRW